MTRQQPDLERWYVLLVSLHSAVVGGMLLFFPAWAARFGGWGDVDTLFFVRQGGAFHFVAVFAYLVEHFKCRGVTVMVLAKSLALVFLLSCVLLDGQPWAVGASGVGDGLMAVIAVLLHRRYSSSR
jgi:hypothetical protein